MLGKMPGSLASDRPDWSGPTAAAEHLAGGWSGNVPSTQYWATYLPRLYVGMKSHNQAQTSVRVFNFRGNNQKSGDQARRPDGTIRRRNVNISTCLLFIMGGL